MKKLQLKLFYSFIFMMMVLLTPLNAQIVYTDVIPDTSLFSNGGIYHLDLNNDGIIDFNIKHTSSSIGPTTYCTGSRTNNYIYVTPSGINEVTGDSINFFTNDLAFNTIINDSTLTWKNDSNQLIESSFWNCTLSLPHFWNQNNLGNWYNAVNGYLGLKLYAGGNIYYGWVRMNTHVSSFTIQDYAYNNIPNNLIAAGDSGNTITENPETISLASISLFPNPSNDNLTIVIGSNNKSVEVTISDLAENIIYKKNIAEAKIIDISTKDLKSGLYLIQIKSEAFLETKKLIVTK
jgi:hypothetical protein